MLALALASILPASGAFEKWLNKDGKSASLELVGLTEKDGEKAAEFKLPNGKTVVIKLSSLAEADAKRAAEGPRGAPTPGASGTGKRIDPDKDIAPLFWLDALPPGAKDFLVGNMVWQPSMGVIWWSGGFVKKAASLNSSPRECLPGLIQFNPTTGKSRMLTIPSGWCAFQDLCKTHVNDYSKPVINPWDAAVHVNGERVVWHTGPLGLWEVDPGRMEVKRLVKKVGLFPTSINNKASAGAFVGDGFCYAEADVDITGKDGWVKEEGPRRVLCVRPGKEPEVLVETSRRPEISALDAADTVLSGLVTIDGVLWVLANTEWAHQSRGIKAGGFPGGGAEGVKSVLDKAQVERMVQTMKKAHQPYFPGTEKWDLGGGLTVASSAKPGRLPVSGPKGETPVTLELPVPKGAGGRYLVQEIKADGSMGDEIEVGLNELANEGYTVPIIVGETDKVFYLMASSLNITCVQLPILWTVSKAWLRTKAGG